MFHYILLYSIQANSVWRYIPSSRPIEPVCPIIARCTAKFPHSPLFLSLPVVHLHVDEPQHTALPKKTLRHYGPLKRRPG